MSVPKRQLSFYEEILRLENLASKGFSTNEICGMVGEPTIWVVHTLAFRKHLPSEVFEGIKEGLIQRNVATMLLTQPELWPEVRSELKLR